ncbi:MAG TPA: acetoin utilization protein AcuC [Rhodothermales bacterium]|nr:acetoin utilization protein AcuC [Rhodothermales bacterium]
MLTVLYHDAYLTYDFGPGHPFSPLRQRLLVSALEALGVARQGFVAPPMASRVDVLGVHDADFVEAIERASGGEQWAGMESYGLGTGDVPAFAGMDEATRVLVGGTLEGARRIAHAGARRVLTLGGGLHHAHRGYASGFCVYNDHGVAIRHLRAAGLRVAYVDVDVHHGDGVQALFYDDPDVLTVSLHETGRTLFPGTGGIEEMGRGPGRGAALNVPLLPGTADESYLDCFERTVPHALAWFRPDVLVVEAGADAHRFDPLAHLALSSHAFETLFRRLVALADEHCGGRMLVTLGGGYHLDSAPRVWTLLYHVLAGKELLERMPEAWRREWQGRVSVHLSEALHDAPARPSAPGVTEGNQETVRRLMERAAAVWMGNCEVGRM